MHNHTNSPPLDEIRAESQRLAVFPAGEPDEGEPWKEVAERHAKTGGLTGWDGTGRFTDDTQMGLALAKSLVRYDKMV